MVVAAGQEPSSLSHHWPDPLVLPINKDDQTQLHNLYRISHFWFLFADHSTMPPTWLRSAMSCLPPPTSCIVQLHFRTNRYLHFPLTWWAQQCLYPGKGIRPPHPPGVHRPNLAVLFLTLGKPSAYCAHGEKDNLDGWPPWITTTLRVSALLLSPHHILPPGVQCPNQSLTSYSSSLPICQARVPALTQVRGLDSSFSTFIQCHEQEWWTPFRSTAGVGHSTGPSSFLLSYLSRSDIQRLMGEKKGGQAEDLGVGGGVEEGGWTGRAWNNGKCLPSSHIFPHEPQFERDWYWWESLGQTTLAQLCFLSHGWLVIAVRRRFLKIFLKHTPRKPMPVHFRKFLPAFWR